MSPTDLPTCINAKLERYFRQLNGEKASNVFKMVINDVEPIVIKHVLEFTKQNQSQDPPLPSGMNDSRVFTHTHI